jgi:hypothetical protein
MASYTTAKVLIGIQEMVGLIVAGIGAVALVAGYNSDASISTMLTSVSAIGIGLVMMAAAQLTRAMIDTAENTAAMLKIMQKQMQKDRDGSSADTPSGRMEPRLTKT